MIASLRGTLAVRDPSGIVVETTGGVGYLVEVPLGTFERLPAVGSEVRLLTARALAAVFNGTDPATALAEAATQANTLLTEYLSR